MKKTLKTLPNTLSEDTHAKLDATILRIIEILPQPWDLAHVLYMLRLNDPTPFKLELCDSDSMGKLVEDCPELRQLILTAIEKKSFKDLRNLAMLRTDGDYSRPDRLHINTVFRQAIEKAWTATYAGDTHSILLANINNMDISRPYGNTVAIVQSSGTGKSRMVDEQAKLVFTIPFNLRPSIESADLAFPPPDSLVADYLTDRSCSTEDGIRQRYSAFFKYLFEEVQAEISSVFSDIQRMQVHEFASKWREHLGFSNGNRSHLYRKVIVKCKESINELPQSDHKSLLEEAKKNLASLSSAMDQYCSFGRDIKIMIYVDEAFVLASKVDELNEITTFDRYELFCSVFSDFNHQRIFVIFLSTQSSLSVLAAPREVSNSSRRLTSNLQAPITETSFDCHPQIGNLPEPLTYESICCIYFLARFGRPLFWSMLTSTGMDGNVIDLARSKILRHDSPDNYIPDFDKPPASALVDIALMLDFEPGRHITHQHQVELVANHMRIAYSVPAHRQYFRSGYPSEPILAEAALKQISLMQNRATRNSNVMVDILLHHLKNGLISLGEHGEVVMRLLLMTAYMRAVEHEQGTQSHPPVSGVVYSRGCSLTGFIGELFSPQYANGILRSLPDNKKSDNPSQSQFANMFCESMIRFTHFVKAADESILNTKAVYAAFIRCMAFIAGASQESVDIIIPILLNGKEKIEQSSMSALLIQVKRRKKMGSINKYRIDAGAKYLDLFSLETGGGDSPYVTLVAELGFQAKTAVQGGRRTHKSTGSNVNIHPQVSRQSRLPKHARYSMIAYGCSSTIYKVITDDERDRFSDLLGVGTLQGDHPRKDADSLRAMWNLKPMWSMKADQNSFHWLEPSTPLLEAEDAMDVEGVQVGMYFAEEWEGMDVD